MIQWLLKLVFPVICYGCGKSISSEMGSICTTCRLEAPKTNAHRKKDNKYEKLFWGKVELQQATAFLDFQKKGKVQRLIHNLKYEGIKEIGITLGTWCANELEEDNFFSGFDALAPIPIHKRKLKIRGYNQSRLIAEGIADVTKLPLLNGAIIKEMNTSSQTRKSRFNRWKNVSSTFRVMDAASIENRHILLVDDVVTTGSTVEACARELLKVKGVKVSLLAMTGTL